MVTIAEALDAAVKSHQAGNLGEAERIYREILKLDQRHADAWHLLGLIEYARGNHAQALEHIARAIQLDPQPATFHNHLAEVYLAQGQPQLAEASCRAAIQRDASSAIFHNTLGNALGALGRQPEALAGYRHAIELQPDFAQAHYNLALALERTGDVTGAEASLRTAIGLKAGYRHALRQLGMLLERLGRFDEALTFYRQALALNPDDVDLHVLMGGILYAQARYDEAAACYREALDVRPELAAAHNGLGDVLQRQEKPDEAVDCYVAALRHDENHAEAHFNLGVIYQSQNRADDAAECYRAAINARPDYVEAHNNLGTIHKLQDNLPAAKSCYETALSYQPAAAESNFNLATILHEDRKYEEAVEHYRAAIRARPEYIQAHNNLGTIYKLQNKLDEARACYEAALSCDHNLAETHRNRALLRLLQGDFRDGWAEYEWRLRVAGAPRMNFAQPRWQGETRPGGTLLVKSEQGLGDSIQFVRYARLVKERFGGLVLWNTPPALRTLLAGVADIDRTVDDPASASFDCYVPMMSLPAIFGITLQTIPANVPYLAAQSERIAHWKQVLAPHAGLRVGIAWQGNPGYTDDIRRSIPLAEFAPLAQLPGVRLFSLQKGHGYEQLAPLAEQLQLVDLGPSLDEAGGAFVDTAAVMKNLDLVITSDTAMAHLAGALGVAVWVPLALVPDWRWLLERDDSPWYPTMRLFRQVQAGDWGEVFARVAAELGSLAATRAGVDVRPVGAATSDAAGHLTRGKTLHAQGRRDEAAAAFRQAVALAPDDAEANFSLAAICQSQQQWEDAIAGYRRSIAIKPDFAAAYNNLAVVLKQQGRLAEAADVLEEALRHEPSMSQLHYNLANVRSGLQQFGPAEVEYRHAIALAPQNMDAYNNLGTMLQLLGRYSEAMSAFDAALACQPDSAEAHRNRALLRLLLGDYAQGWKEYEWRWRVPEPGRPSFSQPRWRGEPAAGRTILVWSEQGRGDILQMIRYAPLAKQRSGARLLVQCTPALHELLQSAAGIDRLVSVREAMAESFDYHVPLMSLPEVLGTTIDTIPADVPYLSAQPQRVAHWREQLARYEGFRVGICWQGSQAFVGDAYRSIPLDQFAPLADCPGVRLFSLQKGFGYEQLAPLAERLQVVDLGASLDEETGAFVDTAAAMKNLDLVITSDTAMAHLAGALGVPVWVAVQLAPNWRWHADREDSPWYPSMRLFRQTRFHDWTDVFARLAAELAKLSQRHTG